MRKKSTGYKLGCIDNNYFSQINLLKYPERFVIVGFIAADGCIHKPKVGQSQLVIGLSEKDKNTLDFINSEICHGERNLWHTKNANALYISIPSEQIANDLAPYGIVPRKTHSLQLPSLPEPQMAYFIRGYFYGDGCVYGEGSRKKYSLIGRNEFCTQLKSYLLHNSIVNQISTYQIKNHPSVSTLEFYGKQTALLSSYLFADEKMKLLPRKHSITSWEDIPTHGSHWTEKENQMLHQCKSYTDLKNLSIKLDRSYESIKQRRRAFGIDFYELANLSSSL